MKNGQIPICRTDDLYIRSVVDGGTHRTDKYGEDRI